MGTSEGLQSQVISYGDLHVPWVGRSSLISIVDGSPELFETIPTLPWSRNHEGLVLGRLNYTDCETGPKWTRIFI